MRSGLLGAMMNPSDGKSVSTLSGITFAADNGRFAENWNESQWLSSLYRLRALQADCLFAVVPDVVADADATHVDWQRWSPVVRGLGYRTAYAAQDGLDLDAVPWDELDVWFTGGTTEWKFSSEAYDALGAAKARGKWAHCGRVNSEKKLRAARDAGYDSADGTYIRFGPDMNLERVRGWVRNLERTPCLAVGVSAKEPE
jgi:hypothetical protein